MKRHLVGRLEELAEGEGRRLDLDGSPVAVFRRGEHVFAVHDSCPHMGAALSEGFIDGTSVVCPWHGWTFDLRTGTSPLDPEECVATYRTVVEDGRVYVEVPPPAAQTPPSKGSADPAAAKGVDGPPSGNDEAGGRAGGDDR